MDRKKILLLRPNSKIERCPPPLGLLYVASFLRDRDPLYDITIHDARNKDNSDEEIFRLIMQKRPDVLGLTGMHPEGPVIHAIARFVRSHLPHCKIIVGGPYVDSDHERAIRDKNIDFIVLGEGEVTFYELMRHFENKKRADEIDGLVYQRNDQIIQTAPRAWIDNLDEIPFPAWDLIDLNDYFFGRKRPLENPFQVHKRALPILSSRGCPYRCIYCHNIFGKKFRARTPQNIIEELKLLKETYNIEEIEFLDDSFNIDYERVIKICELIIENNLNIKICFSNGIRLDLVDEKLLDKLKSAGTYRINYGIESVNERIQKVMKKGLRIDKADEIINSTVDKNILCGAFFMMGFPTETEEEIMETINFAIKSKLHTAVFAIVTPYPGTEILEQAKLEGYNTNIEFGTVFKPSVNMSMVPSERLSELRFYAYRKFYFSPRRAWSIFKTAPSKLPLFKNFIEVVRVSLFKKPLYG